MTRMLHSTHPEERHDSGRVLVVLHRIAVFFGTELELAQSGMHI